MVKSFRGVEVDMNKLAKKYEKTIALGNAHFNGKGDLIGRGGKIIKTREEQLKEYSEANVKTQQGTVMLSDDGSENELLPTVDENSSPAKRGRKPKEENKENVKEDKEPDFIPDEAWFMAV